MNEEKCTIKDIVERLDSIETIIRTLVRQKMSNKSERLMDEVTKKGRLNVKQVESLFNISRPWAINLMGKLGKEYGFHFTKGDINKRLPSIITFNESLLIKDQHNKIQELLNTKGTVRFYDLMQEFGKDITEIKNIVNEFVKDRTDCKIVEGNKLVKLNGNIKS